MGTLKRISTMFNKESPNVEQLLECYGKFIGIDSMSDIMRFKIGGKILKRSVKSI